jgi:hypothetical protein
VLPLSTTCETIRIPRSAARAWVNREFRFLLDLPRRFCEALAADSPALSALRAAGGAATATTNAMLVATTKVLAPPPRRGPGSLPPPGPPMRRRQMKMRMRLRTTTLAQARRAFLPNRPKPPRAFAAERQPVTPDYAIGLVVRSTPGPASRRATLRQPAEAEHHQTRDHRFDRTAPLPQTCSHRRRPTRRPRLRPVRPLHNVRTNRPGALPRLATACKCTFARLSGSTCADPYLSPTALHPRLSGAGLCGDRGFPMPSLTVASTNVLVRATI